RDQVVEQQAAAAVLPAPLAGEYALAQPDRGARIRPASRMSPVGQSATAGTDSPLVVSLECPTCHERVRAKVGASRGQVACTFCGVMLGVPDQQTVSGWQMKKVEPRPREDIGEYGMGPAPETLPVRHGGLFDR